MSIPLQVVKWAGENSVILDGSQTSDAQDISNKDAVGLQLVFSGDATLECTSFLEMSLDGSNWAKDHNSVALVRGSDNYIYNLISYPCPYFRIQIDVTGGAGTATLVAKSYSKAIH